MEKKQTAADWLINKVEEHFCLLPVDLIEQAKGMEKEQSRKDYYGGVRDEMQNIGSDFEDYYNKTYANDTTKGLPEENSKRRGWHY
jgi:conjugal transfer/entry exclusion protein